MPCNCDKYVDCSDRQIEVGIADESAGYKHTYDNEYSVSNMPFNFTNKVKREFSVDYGWDRDVNVARVMSGCSTSGDLVSCDKTSKAVASCVCKENVTMESNTLMFIDRQRDIYVWKNVKEALEWSISSDKVAVFRGKWGNVPFHKVCLPDTIKTKGTETFILRRGGVDITISEEKYEYNPFPNDGPGGTWTLYGGNKKWSAKPDTENVACILCFPTVGKLFMPMDNDVIAYGFYDYNAIEGGFTETSLPKDDGGKDYFYPHWCRMMPHDQLWRDTADTRYEVMYSRGQMNLAGTTDWTAPAPVEYNLPFGSFVVTPDDDFLASCVVQHGEHANSKGYVWNHSTVGDLIDALKKDEKIAVTRLVDFYPMVAL